MALFDKFKQLLISQEKQKKKEYQTEQQKKKEYQTEQQAIIIQDELLGDRKQIKVCQNDKQYRISQLTPREHDLYILLIEGFTLKESAQQLSIKYSTANTHITGIYKKLGVNSRAELIINYRSINSEK